MQLVTKSYLTDIIYRTIRPGIQLRRASQSNHLHYLQNAAATNDELWAFIQSIPYFDERLRDFLMGKPGDSNIIISQTWETNFIIRVKQWADNHTWLHTDPIFSIGFYPQYITRGKDFLTLPY
jgi:uncharacterized protein YciI